MNQNNFVTKGDLKNEFGNFEKKMDKKIEEAVGQIVSAVAKGFEETATKVDLKRVENKVNQLEGKVDKLKTEVMYIKEGVNDLKADAPTDQEFKNHENRIVRLEKKVFPSQTAAVA